MTACFPHLVDLVLNHASQQNIVNGDIRLAGSCSEVRGFAGGSEAAADGPGSWIAQEADKASKEQKERRAVDSV